MDDTSEQSKFFLLTTYGSGALFALGWWMFIDAAAFAVHVGDTVTLDFEYWVPGLLATMFLFLLNLPPWENIKGDGDSLWGSGENRGAKIWVLLCLTCLFGCVIASLWIFSVIWGSGITKAQNQYPGIALVFQNFLLLISALMYRFSRAKDEGSCTISVFSETLQMAVLLLLLFSLSIVAINNQWQGFNHAWKRREVGFEVPHRIGSISNLVFANNTGFVQFTPGVDGDYSFPEIFFQKTHQIKNIHTISTQWTDFTNDSNPDNPFSRSFQSIPLQYPGNYALQGFSLQMACNQNFQPKGHQCNSNGIWPYFFDINILTKSVDFSVYRAWTPSHGGGKAYDYAITFKLDCYLSEYSVKPTQYDLIHKYSELHSNQALQGLIPEFSEFSIAAIQGFGFQFYETDNHVQLGRYLESVEFAVSSEGSFSMQLHAPLTTHNSKYSAWIRPISFKSFDEPLKTQHANGTVCFSSKAHGDFFKCSNHQMKDDTKSYFPV